ncbi:MAG: PilT protein domain protein [Frankiales bacterium]|nr:PilT protein domain protein [Frankiales bacterium]
MSTSQVHEAPGPDETPQGGLVPGPSSSPARSSAASPPVRTRQPRTPYAVLEVLRLLVVVFFAGAGYQIGSSVDADRPVLGALNGTAVGLVLGSGFGYVLGGVLGRKTASTAETARTRLRDVSADTLVAGALGLVGGVLLGAGVAWPVFFLPQAYLAFPLFGFVVVVLGYLGAQVAMSKREGVLAMFGERAGLAPRDRPASTLPRVIDTSVAIDGRVLDVVRAGFLHGTVLVPTPVLTELQGLADAGDDLRRGRGRRGLEVLEALKREDGVALEVLDLDVPGVHEVDAKLVRICLDRGAALLTLDTNLAKAASLAGVRVLNLHALSLAMRPPVAAGDEVAVLLLKAGKEAGQAVGYLDDGSMVVVERGRSRVGQEVQVLVTSVLTTANGRLVFGRPAEEPEEPPVRPRRSTPVVGGRPSPSTMPGRRPS